MDPGPQLFDGSGTGLAGRLAAWVAEGRTAAAAEARSRESFLRRAAGEEATVVGVLLDLAEAGAPVLVVCAAGRRHRGVIAGVGRDFCALRTAEGREVLLHHDAIASVRPEAHGTIGDRDAELPVALAEALAVLAEDRPRVLVVTRMTDGGIAGELRSAGRDVLVVQLDGDDRRLAYVPLAAIAEVTVA